MKKIFNTLILLAFFAFLSPVSPARADAPQPVPAEMTGNWGFPGCYNSEQTIVFTKHYAFDLMQDRVGLKRIWLKSRGLDYDVFSTDQDVLFVMSLARSGVLTIATLKAGIEPDTLTEWDDLQIEQRTEFSRCDKVSAADASRQAVLDVAAVIDVVQDACSEKFDETCAQVLFAVADANGNSKLTPSEIYFFVKKLGFMASFAEQSQKSDAILATDLEVIDQQAKKIPRQVIFNFDSDKTQDVSYQELYGLDLGLTENAPALYFADAIKKAARFFPALSGVDFNFRTKN